MKNYFIKLLYVYFFIHLAEDTNAQYITGIGPRLGFSKGVAVIQYFFPRDRGAADFIIANRFGGWGFTALYEVHSKNHGKTIEVANVGFFWGAGGHVGIFKGTQYKQSDKNRVFEIGLDVIAGVEWKLPHVPLLLSLDVKPFIDIDYKNQPDFLDVAIALKLLLKKARGRSKF